MDAFADFYKMPLRQILRRWVGVSVFSPVFLILIIMAILVVIPLAIIIGIGYGLILLFGLK
jgi:hypothetical protein